jgi:hypothetical protein
MTTPGVTIYRHNDGSECLWSASEHGWLRMHPLYPTVECKAEHATTPVPVVDDHPEAKEASQ